MISRVYIADCDVGKGVFAARAIRATEPILAFKGHIINAAQVSAKGKAQSNPLQVAMDKYIDVEPPGVFTNHSCEPNAGVKSDCILVALRDIAKGDEIRFDYSTTMSENNWTMVCKCRKKRCRKVVKDFHLLPEHIKELYISLDIVQGFIVAEYLQVKSTRHATVEHRPRLRGARDVVEERLQYHAALPL